METTNIYTLSDPRTGMVRYVGKANNHKRRLYLHTLKSKQLKTHRDCWIYGLLSENKKPIIDVIDEVSIYEWQFWERHYISLYRSWGFDLTNSTDGGEGIHNPPEEIRIKMGIRNKGNSHWLGRKHSNESIELIRQAKIGKPCKRKGIPRTEQEKRNISIGVLKKRDKLGYWKGKKMPKHTREIISSRKSIPIIQYTISGDIVREWVSASKAGEELGHSKGNISNACKNNKKCLGFIWKYKNK